MDTLSASKKAPLSSCCQRSEPEFSGEQVETYSSIKRFAFSGDVVHLNAFVPLTLVLWFVLLLILALDLLPGLIGLPLRARPLLFPVSYLGWRPDV